MLTRTTANKRSDIFGVLDIGTSKTVCLIVSPPKARGGMWRRPVVRVLGVGHAQTRGLKAGVVIDMDRAEHGIRAAVAQAEQMAKASPRDTYVAVTCGRLKSTTFEADTRIQRRTIEQADIDRLLAAGRRYAGRDGRTVLHMNVLGYRLNGTVRVSDPIGMAGKTLVADLHAVTADDGPLNNLLYGIERAGPAVAGIAPAPYASGLASTTEQERANGVMCIDMGAGTTTLSLFADGRLVSVDTLAVGSQHVTFDIARSLSTPFDEAERIKSLCGTLDAAASDDQGMVAYTLAGEEEPTLHQTTKAHIHGIIGTRVADLLGHVVERVARSGGTPSASHRVVLTGGASQLPGLKDFAERALARPVRIARLQPAPGLPQECCSPAFATAVGLIQVALDPSAGSRSAPRLAQIGAPGYFKRVGQWLRDGA